MPLSPNLDTHCHGENKRGKAKRKRGTVYNGSTLLHSALGKAENSSKAKKKKKKKAKGKSMLF